MCKQKIEREVVFLRSCKERLEILRFHLQDKTARKLSGNVSLNKVLMVLDSLKEDLLSPPHYPMRLITELAEELKIPIARAKRLMVFLKKENLVSYSCNFEAKNEGHNKTILEINKTPGLCVSFG